MIMFLLKVILTVIPLLIKTFLIAVGVCSAILLLVFAVALIADKMGLLGEFNKGYDDE